ncbi:MAG TPA: chromosomal replication initiator protein DnaA [Actinomycetota bacterium]|nr:chromosomal replication initiator protein DnaA [Actinomycetota bacterium]
MTSSLAETPSAGPSDAAEAAWLAVLERARRELSESSFEFWFSGLAPGELQDNSFEIIAPSAYVKTRLSAQHMGLITGAVRDVLGPDVVVRLRTPATEDTSTAKARRRQQAATPGQATLDQSLEESPFPGRYMFDTFVTGPSNKFAHAAALAVAESPPSKAYNPVFVYGGVGLGKTHLLFAIANHVWTLSRKTRVRYVTSESFVTEFIKAVRERRGYLFQRQYRDVDVLLLDDVQFLARAEETQTEFFHTFNHLHQYQRQIVIASDRPPQELGGIEERLRSRFRSGLVVDIQPPDLETRIAILQLKALHDGLSIPDEVLHFIASKFEDNIRELEGALLRVAAFASLTRRPADLLLAEESLEDLIPESGQEILPVTILEETAAYFGLTPEDLVSKSRSRPMTTARHMAMYLLRELTGLSLIKIGERFDRDHTTAIHGIRKIESLMPARGSVYRQVQELTKKIRAQSRDR